MQLGHPDSGVRRVVITIALAAAIMVVGGLVYVFLAAAPAGGKVNGIAIVGAGKTYARELKSRGQPVPKTVSLNELVERGYLKPEDIGAFRGLEATLSLTADLSNPKTVLMRVRLPDGTDYVLLADGSAQEAPR
ncbi:MAG: hypothetical protein ABSG59_03445 [Verrucomicrobiota bacterium]|jgi:hypothetical protein